MGDRPMSQLPTCSRPGSSATGRTGTTTRLPSWRTATQSETRPSALAYAAHDLDVPARYEVHLDRKLERTLAMLFRLKELRQPATPA